MRSTGSSGPKSPAQIAAPQPSPPGLLRKGEEATRYLLGLPGLDLDRPDAFTRYFEEFRALINDDGAGMLNKLTVDAETLDFPFRSFARDFAIIDQDAVPVLVRYGEGAVLAEDIRREGVNRERWRRAQRYCVTMPSRMAETLTRNGLIEEMADGLYGQGDLLNYDEATGLSVYQKGIDPGRLIVSGDD